MFGLTNIGVVHTLISLVAVAAGAVAFAKDGRIGSSNGVGKLYITTTILTCLTGFFIFQHGGFGKPHMLGIITLITLAVAAIAGKGKLGSLSPYIETVSYSATFLFHMIPAITETTTRLPLGAPLLPNADAPALQAASGVLLLLFLVGATVQVRRIKASRAS